MVRAVSTRSIPAACAKRCAAPNSFAATWEYGSDVSWIELRLVPVGNGRTRLEPEHTAHVDDERWVQDGPGAVGVGWDLALMGLTGHLESGKTVDPAAAGHGAPRTRAGSS
jgi:hypothetical protein